MVLVLPQGQVFNEDVVNMINDHLKTRQIELRQENVNLKLLLILRGLPGVGKSTFARNMHRLSRFNGWSCEICSADDWFMYGDAYQFNPDQLPRAHRYCQGLCLLAMYEGVNVVIIDNTNRLEGHVEEYINFSHVFHAYEVKVLEWMPTFEEAEACLERSHVEADHYPLYDKFMDFYPFDGAISIPIEGLGANEFEREAFRRGYGQRQP